MSQREEAIQFLIDIVYELLPAAERWLEINHNDATFLHPGLEDGEPKITCYRTASGKQKILFSGIEALIAQNDTSIDERSDDEFEKDFKMLLWGGRNRYDW